MSPNSHTMSSHTPTHMQRYTSYLPFLFLLFLFSACSGATATDPATSETDPSNAASPANPNAPASGGSPGNATWSATIDGQNVSGTGIDGLQQRNAAYQIQVGNANDKALLFYLFDTKGGADDAKFTHSVRFCMPDMEGAKHIDRSSPDHNQYGLTVNLVPDDAHAYRYYSADINVTISSRNASHVSGTFSGKFTVSPDSPNAPKTEIQVTDGKFDIPMATSKLIPS